MPAHDHACHAAVVVAPCVLPTGTTVGQDLNLSLDRVTANRNFTNKLWNAGGCGAYQTTGQGLPTALCQGDV